MSILADFIISICLNLINLTANIKELIINHGGYLLQVNPALIFTLIMDKNQSTQHNYVGAIPLC